MYWHLSWESMDVSIRVYFTFHSIDLYVCLYSNTTLIVLLWNYSNFLKSRSMSSSTLFLLWIVLTMLSPSHQFINFKIRLLISAKKKIAEVSMGIVSNPQITWRRTDILTLSIPIHDHERSLHLLRSLIPSAVLFIVSVYKPYTLFATLIPALLLLSIKFFLCFIFNLFIAKT